MTVSGANLTQWNDKSGSGNHATDASTANFRPILTRSDNKENKCLYSYDFSYSGYSSTNLTSATYGAVADSGGAMNGTTLLCSNVSGRHSRTQAMSYTSGLTSRSVTYSVEIKKGNWQFAWIGDGAHSSWHGISFDFDTGALGTPSTLTSSSKESIGGGWWRITITYSVSDTASCSCGVYFNDIADSSAPRSFATAGTETMHACHAHFRDAEASSDYVQTTDVKQIRGMNSKSCVIFDGTDDYMPVNGIAATLSGTDVPYTLFMAVRRIASNACLFSASKSSGTTTYIAHKIETQSSPPLPQYSIMREDSGGTTVSVAGGTSTSTTRVDVLCAKNTGTTLTHYLNGVQTGTGAFDTGITTIQIATIGCLNRGGTFAEYFTGKIGEIVLYNSALTDANRYSATQYLINKWT